MADTFAFIQTLSKVVEKTLPDGKYQVMLRVNTTAERRSDVYREIQSLESMFGVVAVIVEYNAPVPPLVRVTGALGNVTAFLARYYGLE